MTPCLMRLPNMNIGAAAPWSVPPEAFCSTRRPNSLKVITSTRSEFFCDSRSFQNAPMPAGHPQNVVAADLRIHRRTMQEIQLRTRGDLDPFVLVQANDRRRRRV